MHVQRGLQYLLFVSVTFQDLRSLMLHPHLCFGFACLFCGLCELQDIQNQTLVHSHSRVWLARLHSEKRKFYPTVLLCVHVCYTIDVLIQCITSVYTPWTTALYRALDIHMRTYACFPHRGVMLYGNTAVQLSSLRGEVKVMDGGW